MDRTIILQLYSLIVIVLIIITIATVRFLYMQEQMKKWEEEDKLDKMIENMYNHTNIIKNTTKINYLRDTNGMVQSTN